MAAKGKKQVAPRQQKQKHGYEFGGPYVAVQLFPFLAL